jgi:hypothetical protein
MSDRNLTEQEKGLNEGLEYAAKWVADSGNANYDQPRWFLNCLR